MDYSNNNFGYQQNFNNGFVNGGYPQGYPPIMPQQMGYGMIPGQGQYSPFISPFPNPTPAPFVPGLSPMEHTDANGNTTVINPATGYNPGGATISQGGFNPVNGVVSQPVGVNGFNPFTRFIGNPGYVVQNNQQQGYAPYSPPPYPQGSYAYNMAKYGTPNIPYGIAPYMTNGYGQNQFDYQLQDYLYNETPSAMDTMEMLERVILTDAEREKIDHNRNSYYGYDYYGRPIYGNAYQRSQQQQNQFEEARKSYQNHFTMLSKIAHAYSGEEIDEDEMMKRWDPVPPRQEQKIFNYYTATDEEKKEFERNQRMAATHQLVTQLENAQGYNNWMQMQKQEAFKKIKESHDRLIGVEPGQHYDLKTYLDNGYKINVNIAMQKAKSLNRNGTSKYSRNNYRGNISQSGGSPVPITSKDDEYVSIEQMLKGVYDRNKTVDSILRSQNGQTTFTSEPAFNSEYEAHKYFMETVQNMKNKDDVRKSING